LVLSKKGKARQLVVVTLRRAEFDRDVVALDTASVLQALPECGHQGVRVVEQRASEKPNYRPTRLTLSETAAASTMGSIFTLSMGCGTWRGNSISENLNYRHFINITHLVTSIPEVKPSEEELLGAYWSKYGRRSAQ
jgi:hypothetical protein